MKTHHLIISFSVMAISAFVIGCSQEDREVATNRLGDAVDALKGSGDETPKIVKEQQRKERVRQNSTWTAENRALHPIEYCQAQLEELSKYGQRLDVQSYQLATIKSSLRREIENRTVELKETQSFLKEAKSAYRTADAANQWPLKMNGFELSKTKAQERIVEAAARLPKIEERIRKAQANLNRAEQRMAAVLSGKTKVSETRERIQLTISDLKTRKVLDGEKEVVDALNAINDAVGTLGIEADGPSLDELMMPNGEAQREKEFQRIMSN